MSEKKTNEVAEQSVPNTAELPATVEEYKEALDEMAKVSKRNNWIFGGVGVIVGAGLALLGIKVFGKGASGASTEATTTSEEFSSDIF